MRRSVLFDRWMEWFYVMAYHTLCKYDMDLVHNRNPSEAGNHAVPYDIDRSV